MMKFPAMTAGLALTALLATTAPALAAAPERDELSHAQIVRSAFPEGEARQSLRPDASWKSAGSRHFTGEVTTKSAFRQTAPARSYGAYVRFSPGARTFWHVHPLGQTLLVVDGVGLTQAVLPDGRLGPIERIRAGDVVTCPPGVMHWHGASPDAPMTHLAISESDPKTPVVWKDPVDERLYLEGAKKALQNEK